MIRIDLGHLLHFNYWTYTAHIDIAYITSNMEQLTQQSVKPNFNIDYIIGKHSSSFSKCSLFQATQTHKKKKKVGKALLSAKLKLIYA